MKILLPFIAFAPIYALAEVPAGYEYVAASLKPQFSVASNAVNRSARVESLDFSGNVLSVLAVIGAVDTTKPKEQSNMITDEQISEFRSTLVNAYCAPLGGGELHLSALRQQKMKIIYNISASSEVMISSFSVSEKDCA